MKKLRVLSLAALMVCSTLVSCGANDSQPLSSTPTFSEAGTSETVSSETNYVNPLEYAEPNWSYSTWGGQKVMGGTYTKEEYYDEYPSITNKVATYNYLVINREIDPSTCLTSAFLTDPNEKDGAEYFINLARKIVPDWDSEESKTDPKKIEKNVLTIYDYVVTHVYYDNKVVERDQVTKGYYLNGMIKYSYLVDNPFECKIFTVCRGYCNLINVMMNAIGVPCIEDKGREYYTTQGYISDYSNHVWNEVYYNGRWHVLDATWESNVAGKGYWYDCDNGTYSEGTYDNKNRQYYDTIPDYTNWGDVRNYTNYGGQTHIIESRHDDEIMDAVYTDPVSKFETKITLSNFAIPTETEFKDTEHPFARTVDTTKIVGYTGELTETITTPQTIPFSYKYTNVKGVERDVNFELVVDGIERQGLNNKLAGVKNLVVDVAENAPSYEVRSKSIANNASLESVIFNAGVTYVQNDTFEGNNTNLTSVRFCGDPVEINGGSTAILKGKSITIYYPAENEKWASAVVDGKYLGKTAVAYALS